MSARKAASIAKSSNTAGIAAKKVTGAAKKPLSASMTKGIRVTKTASQPHAAGGPLDRAPADEKPVEIDAPPGLLPKPNKDALDRRLYQLWACAILTYVSSSWRGCGRSS